MSFLFPNMFSVVPNFYMGWKHLPSSEVVLQISPCSVITLYHHGTTISSPWEISHFCSSSHSDHYQPGVAARMWNHLEIHAKIYRLLGRNKFNLSNNTTWQTFAVELDNIESMLMQIELTVMAGDQESYRMSVWTWTTKRT